MILFISISMLVHGALSLNSEGEQINIKPGSPVCLKSGCKYISKLDIEPEDKNEYHVVNTELGIMGFKEAKASVYELIIQKKSRYCRYSLFGDNRGCEEWSTQNIIVSREELIRSVEENTCLLGKDCHRGQDCWGNDALACKDDKRTRKVNIREAPKTHPEMVPWENVFYDTCEQSWVCELIETRSTLQFSNTEYQSAVLDISGELIGINYNHYTHLKFLEGNKIVEPVHIKASKVPATCIYNKVEAFCRKTTKETNSTKSSLFVFKNKCHSDDHSELVTINCNQIPLKAGDLSEGVLHSPPMGASSSIGDLRKLNEILRFESMETAYNVKLLQRKIWDIKSMIIKMILAVSESNPYFLGALLDKPSYTTVFGRKIRMCPCFAHRSGNGTEKCLGEFISKGNIWVKRKVDDFCPTHDDTDPGSPLFLFKDEGKLMLHEIPELDFESSDDLSLILKNSKIISELMGGSPSTKHPTSDGGNGLFSSITDLWSKFQEWILWGLVILNTWTIVFVRR